VLSQFKEGVRNQVDKGDTETHYDLGIAYMEMGLHGEAIEEFKLCLDSGEKQATAHHMIGLSHVAKGEMAPAVAAFMAALESPDVTEREQLDLWFEVGNAHELMGKANEALIWYEQVEEQDPEFRDVAERIERLGVIKSEEQEVDEFDEMFDNMILKD
jgi:tetratricopeptide (TPR) repeat protein